MTMFLPTPEGRAAAQRMYELYGHTMGPFKPRPGFPGRSGVSQNPPINQVKPSSDRLGPTPEPAQAPDPVQVRPSLPPPPQHPTGRSGRGTTPATPPSFASQMRGMGLAGIPNPTLPEPTGMSPTQSQAVQAVINKMQGAKLGGFTGMKKGGAVKKKASSKSYKSGGSVSSASKRADGCAIKGKTKGKMV